MTISDFQNPDFPALRLNDTVDKALQLLEECKCNALPLVKDQKVMGVVSQELLENYDLKIPLKNINLSVPAPVIHLHQTLIEVAKLFKNVSFDTLPLIDSEEKFLGVIQKYQVFEFLIGKTGLLSGQSEIEIKLKNTDYSLSQIIHLVEAEKAKILGLLTDSDSENHLFVTLILETNNISSVKNSLERFGFNVSAYQSQEEVFSLEKERYNLLMKYLNI